MPLNKETKPKFYSRYFYIHNFNFHTLFVFISRNMKKNTYFTMLSSRMSWVRSPYWPWLYLVRRARHAGHCWRSKDEHVSDVLLWTPTYGQAKAGRPARTYIQQLCDDTGCNPEDLPEAMNDREKWRERIRDIRAGGTTWWWWWLC